MNRVAGHAECAPSGRGVQQSWRHLRIRHATWHAAAYSSRPKRRFRRLEGLASSSTADSGLNAGLNGNGATAPEDDRAGVLTKFVAETLLPTNQGKFRLRGYRHTTDGGKTFTEPSAIISGSVEGQQEVLVRVHDACFTSEVLGSLKCDCREQLALALEVIQAQPPGMVIYLQQEGRGIGLANKIAAYALQEKGLDTVDANRALGLPDDCREYSAVRHILQDLGVKSIRLMTNNPRKIALISSLGITVTDRLPCIVKAQPHNRGYLAAKQQRMDHIMSDDELDGQFCYWDHEGEPGPAGIPLEPATPVEDAGRVIAAVDAEVEARRSGSEGESGSGGSVCDQS